MSSNNFSGKFSSNTLTLKYLKYIEIINNQFYCAIASSSIGTLKYLEHLDFHCNHFEGSISKDDEMFLLRIFNKDNANAFGKIGKIKYLAADCLLIDEHDDDDNVDRKDVNKENNEEDMLVALNPYTLTPIASTMLRSCLLLLLR